MGKGIKADAKKAKGKKETEERKAGEKRMQENPVMHEVRDRRAAVLPLNLCRGDENR